jgi:hypothetical protein
MTIIYRTDGPHGPGKPGNLTASEVDGNFFDLAARVASLEESGGIEPNQIYSIDVVDNQMTITMDDLTTVYGPFPLPVAAFTWTDAYQPNFEYALYDFFTADDGMYLVLQAHESATEFDPAEFNSEGALYELVFPYPTTLDIGFFFPGAPGYGIEVGEAMFAFLANRDFYFEAGLPLSAAALRDFPTEEIVFPIYKNDDSIGTITFAPSDTVGVFEFDDPVQMEAGDVLRVLRQTGSLSEFDIDATAYDLMVTFRATKGTL